MKLWAGIALALMLMVGFAHFCVRIVPGERGASVAADKDAVGQNAGASGSALLIPVEHIAPAALVDTFGQARAGGIRHHDAIDIMAPRGSAVLAAADGRVERLFWSREGGHTLYQRALGGRAVYYYAHLDRYAPGVQEGQMLRRGQRIAMVGSSGNADPSAPHLHFAVHVLRPDEPWYKGRPINPYPLLVARR